MDDQDVMDTIIATERIEEMDEPLSITIPEVLVAQRCNDFCREVLISQKQGENRFVETDDGVLLSIPPG